MSFINHQVDIIKLGAIGGSVVIGLSLATPYISTIFPETIRGFFFQTYQNPIGAFINQIFIIWLTFFLLEQFDVFENVVGLRQISI